VIPFSPYITSILANSAGKNVNAMFVMLSTGCLAMSGATIQSGGTKPPLSKSGGTGGQTAANGTSQGILCCFSLML